MIVEAQYLLRTDDGVTIQVNNRGMRHGPEAVMRRLAAGERSTRPSTISAPPRGCPPLPDATSG